MLTEKLMEVVTALTVLTEDTAKADSGNKAAERRVRVALQEVRRELQEIRHESLKKEGVKE